MPSQRFDFSNAKGERLAALLDLPLDKPRAYALFAHCFTCGKDTHAAKRIAEGLTGLGIAVLRFDFTGLGGSEGEFANTHFSSNVADLVAAANHLEEKLHAPSLLIGHSLGGAAVLAAAAQIPDARAVVTIAAPAEAAHVTRLFRDKIEDIKAKGEIGVALAGRPFRIKREFLEDIAQQKLSDHIANLRKALLLFHSPTDEIVGIENATRIFVTAKHPKSFVSLAGADHLLTRKSDAAYVADVIAAWAERYLEMPAAEQKIETQGVTVAETGRGKLQQEVKAGTHTFLADEPEAAGGLGSGPTPYDLLLAALGACTSMTLRLYAERKKIPLGRIAVALRHSRIYAKDCAECENKEGMIDQIDRDISFEGDIDTETRARLMEIADKCPVHRSLTSRVNIRSKFVSPGD